MQVFRRPFRLAFKNGLEGLGREGLTHPGEWDRDPTPVRVMKPLVVAALTGKKKPFTLKGTNELPGGQ